MSSRFAHAPQVVVEEIDPDICLYRPDIDEVIVLNSSGADIWRLSDTNGEPHEIAAILATAYSTTVKLVINDVQNVLTDLADRGYLTRTEDTAADLAAADNPANAAS